MEKKEEKFSSEWNSENESSESRAEPDAETLNESLLRSSFRMMGIDDIGADDRFFSAGDEFPTSNAFYDSNSHAVTINSWDDSASSGPLRFQIIPRRNGNGGRAQSEAERTKRVFCQFCRNSCYLRRNYLTHSLRDPSTNRLTCPVLRSYICHICGGTGDSAHTIQRCLLNRMKHKNSPRKSRPA